MADETRTTGTRDRLGYLRWTETSCRRCGYERADCTCIGGFAEPMNENQTTPKLGEIADRIAAHLAKIEKAQPDHGSARSGYWHANAWPAGGRIGVKYISYQHTWHLTKADALRYLQWLDAGNVGRHREALQDAA